MESSLLAAKSRLRRMQAHFPSHGQLMGRNGGASSRGYITYRKKEEAMLGREETEPTRSFFSSWFNFLRKLLTFIGLFWFLQLGTMTPDGSFFPLFNVY